MPEFWIKENCTACGHKWKFKAFSYTQDASDVPDPACPKCANVQQDIGLDVAAGKAPGIGGSSIVKAMDYAMETTAEDYGLTDLKTDGRVGATMAPSLPPVQQQRADAMFSGKGMRGMLGPKAKSMVSSMTAAARQGKTLGAFAGAAQAVRNPIADIHQAKQRPNVQLLNPRRADGSIVT